MEAIVQSDWSQPNVRVRTTGSSHVLRREAEGMILPDLPAFPGGENEPEESGERLAMLGVCLILNRHRCCGNNGATQTPSRPTPELMDNKNARHHYYRRPGGRSGRLRAGAGCKRRERSGTEAEWRKQGLEWLRADLTRIDQVNDRDVTAYRIVVHDSR